jgi:hypothetical protein
VSASTDPLDAWLRLWNGRLDLLKQTVHPDFRSHVPGMDSYDRTMLFRVIDSLRTRFDVFSVTPDLGPITTGDLTAGRWTAVAVTAGEASYWVGHSILRSKDGLILEHWEVNSQLQGNPFPIPSSST